MPLARVRVVRSLSSTLARAVRLRLSSSAARDTACSKLMAGDAFASDVCLRLEGLRAQGQTIF